MTFVVAFLILAGLGWLNPVVAALLHMLGATVVIFNSARLVRFGEELHEGEPEAPAAPQPRLEPVPA